MKMKMENLLLRSFSISDKEMIPWHLNLDLPIAIAIRFPKLMILFNLFSGTSFR